MKQGITKIVLCFLCLLIIALYGCAATNKKADIEPIENHMGKIAVIGESKICYPRQGGKPPALDLGASKKALEIHLHKVKDILKEKGYDIQYCKPAGVGYFYINNENWVFEDYENSKNKWQIENGETVYEYPGIKENEKFRRAVKRAFERSTVASDTGQFNNFLPVKHEFDLAALRKATEADTICFNRIYGNKYTTSRKVGVTAAQVGMFVLGAMVGVVVVPTGPPHDTVGSCITCISASTGEMLWNGCQSISHDPIDEKGNIMKKVLSSFPHRDQPMNQNVMRNAE